MGISVQTDYQSSGLLQRIGYLVPKRIIALGALLLCLLFQSSVALADNEISPAAICETLGPMGDAIPLSSLGKAAIGLQTETVHLQPLSAQIATTGKIEAIPTREFNQQSLISGRINRILVQPGQEVRAGQVLIMLDSPEINELTAETLQSRSELQSQINKTTAMMDAEINQARAQLNLAELNLKRSEQLNSEGISAKREVQAYSADVSLAKSRLEAAQQQKTIALAALRTKLKVAFESLIYRLGQLGVPKSDLERMLKTQNTIKEVPVTSTKSGTITEITATVGSAVSASVELFKVSDLGVVWGTADVYEDDMSRIELGQKVVVKVGALPNQVFRGRVTFIGRVLDPATRTLPVRVEIDNSELKLKPDMFATLYIETTEASQSVIVPREAVVERTGHHIVFVESPAGYQAYRVDLGRSIGDNVEVLAGLKPGQKVVTRGAFQLDAELLKSHGRADLFVSPTEGDKNEAAAHQSQAANSSSGFNFQIIAVLVLAAFFLGFLASLVFAKSHRTPVLPESSRVPAADQEALPKS
jgi:membrane fusion protein, heavy metal efflux system